MQRLVMNLLDIGRSEDGNLALQFECFDLAAMLEDACRLVRVRCDERSLSIGSESTVSVIRADRAVLQRVIDNLLDNAIKYSELGGSIRLRALKTDQGIAIRVSDEGRGIPPDKRELVFEKNFRLERDSDLHTSSSRGLGLAFCRLAVEAHGGRIWAESNTPRGTTFCLHLPSESDAEVNAE